MSNPLLDAALEYREAGLHPIPCEPRGKRPMVPWKEYQDHTPSVGLIEGWWRDTPDANIALVLGRGMFAVDIDGAEGFDALRDAGVEFNADYPRTSTGKGAHVFMAGTAPDRVGLLPSVDIRGVGYVIAPPSVHPSGVPYRWLRSFEGALPFAPTALMALLAAPKPMVERNGRDWLLDALGGVGEGGRDATCTRLAGYLLGKGIPADAVEKLMLSWAILCEPPFPDDQVRKCVQSIAKREGEHAAPEGLPPTVADIVPATVRLIEQPARPVRATGLGALDTLLDGGLENGTLTLLGARPGVGKTALMLQIARTVARSGQGVFFLTLEMGATRLVRRMLSQESQVRFKGIKTGDLIDLERSMLTLGAARLAELPLWVETRVRTVEALDEVLGRFEPGQLGLVVVDYLQKFRSRGGDRRAEVESVSGALTDVAVSRDIPILAASSLSRPPKASPNWRPALSDLRDSGQLEHDGDNVLLAHRDDSSEDFELRLAKQRDGETGSVTLTYRGETLTFLERR